MRVAIIGLPNSSKTTVFNALTGGEAAISAAAAVQLTVHRAVVDVPDPRVEALAALYQPRKVTHARVEYHDVAGLAKGIGAGGLSGELLGAIAQCDALLHVVRAFEDANVPHPEGSVDPGRDVAVVDTELLISDLIIADKRLERLADALRRPGKSPERDAQLAEQALLGRLHEALEREVPVRDLELTAEEEKSIRGFTLLTAKPVLVLLNTGDLAVADAATLLVYPHRHAAVLTIRGRIEMEIAQLAAADRADFLAEYGLAEPGLNRVIRACYELLGLQSFFTVSEDEVRAWTVPVGATALDAAAAIHTDLARGFIRAEVVTFDDLVAAGSMVEARKAGRVRLEGKDTVVHDGDVVHVRFKV
jgi:hypothetical protein